MSTDRLRAGWIEKASASFLRLMESKTETVFDSFLFDDQFTNFVCRADIKFQDNGEKEFRDIRATRLKLTGYSWVSSGKYWSIKQL